MKKKLSIPITLIFGVLLLSFVSQAASADTYVVKQAIATADPPTDGWQNVENGVRVNISAGNRTRLRTQNGTQIRLRTQENVSLHLTETDDNPEGPLPNKTRNVIRFMNVELNGTTAMNATMFHNFTHVELTGLGNYSTFRWAYYNEESFEWQYAYENWVEERPDGAAVFCNTTHFSTWVILAPQVVDAPPVDKPNPENAYNSKNGTAFALQGGNRYQIRTQSGFSLQIQLNKSAEVTVTEYEESPQLMNRERHRIRTQTMSVELNCSAGINATFAYEFSHENRTQMGIKNMEKLKFMFYNETSNEWEAPKNQWIEGDTLYCNTTHFSLWTIAEEEVDSSSTPSFTLLPLLGTLATIIIIRRRK